MPSRKVISIFIIAVAFVIAITLVTKPGTYAIAGKSIGKAVGTLSNSPTNSYKINIQANTNWQGDLSELSASPSETETPNPTDDTMTDQLSRSLMANYFSMKQSGTLDQNSMTDLVNKAQDFVETSAPISQYSLKDIVVSPDNSKTAITAYGNALGYAFKINKPKSPIQNELAIFKDMMQNADGSKALELKNIALVYKNTAASLSKIIVPSSFGGDHLALVNEINYISASVSNLAIGLDDPLKALSTIGVYQKSFTGFINTKNSIGIKILNSGANYKQGDNGYFFYFGI